MTVLLHNPPGRLTQLTPALLAALRDEKMSPESSAVEENLILTLAKPTKNRGKLLILSSLRLKREGYARGDRFTSFDLLFV